jgi:hypothetical protein
MNNPYQLAVLLAGFQSLAKRARVKLWTLLFPIGFLLNCSAPPCAETVTYREASQRFASSIARCGLTSTGQSVFGDAILDVAPCKSTMRICSRDVDACASKIATADCSTATYTTCVLGCFQ